MTGLFWIISGIMISVAAILVIWPLWRGGKAMAPVLESEALQTDVDVFRDRLAELTREQADGLWDAETAGQARTELERQLLAETARLAVKQHVIGGSRWLAMTVGVVFVFAALGVYRHISPDSLQQLVKTEERQKNRQTFVQLVDRLTQHLIANPQDGQGWYVLGHSHLALTQFPQAVDAYKQARVRLGDTPEVLISLAEAMTRAQNNNFTPEIRQLLEQALQQRPDDPTALWLGGLAASNDGDYGLAITRWQRLKNLGHDPEITQFMDDNLAMAKAKLTETGQVSPGADHARLQVRVEVSPELTARVNVDDVLFVYAQAVDGPPMPLAIARRRAGELPLTLVLDDSMAMTPGMALTRFPQIRVTARISRSGRAEPQSGDLIGRSQPTGPQNPAQVDVKIDTLNP